MNNRRTLIAWFFFLLGCAVLVLFTLDDNNKRLAKAAPGVTPSAFVVAQVPPPAVKGLTTPHATNAPVIVTPTATPTPAAPTSDPAAIFVLMAQFTATADARNYEITKIARAYTQSAIDAATVHDRQATATQDAVNATMQAMSIDATRAAVPLTQTPAAATQQAIAVNAYLDQRKAKVHEWTDPAAVAFGNLAPLLLVLSGVAIAFILAIGWTRKQRGAVTPIDPDTVPVPAEDVTQTEGGRLAEIVYLILDLHYESGLAVTRDEFVSAGHGSQGEWNNANTIFRAVGLKGEKGWIDGKDYKQALNCIYDCVRFDPGGKVWTRSNKNVHKFTHLRTVATPPLSNGVTVGGTVANGERERDVRDEYLG